MIDLSPPRLIEQDAGESSPAAGVRGADSAWLANTCRADLQCDVVVISAEFAGRFFGAYGTSMGMQEMEEASCQQSCQGLFHAPREVFLLACNTLATKDADARSPEEYLRVLLDHGFDRGSAERVTALRYGPLGPSFREALRRIFQGVPRIYGFTSIAPAGDYTARALEKYFRAKGDYRVYLERVARSTQPNRELLKTFRNTDIVQVAGLSTREPANMDRARICALYDEGVSVAERLRIVGSMLDRPDFLAFLPSIEVFTQRHPGDGLQGEERILFEQVRGRTHARDRVLELVRHYDVSALKMELAHMAVQLEWITHEEFHGLALDGARKLIAQPLSWEAVEIMCEIAKHEPIGDEIPSEELPDTLFQSGEGIRFVDCLAPKDERVTERLLPALDAHDIWTRLWAAYTISRRMPLADDVLLALAQHLGEPPLAQQQRLRWILLVQNGVSEEVRRTVAQHDPDFAAELPRRPGASRSLRPAH